ncbi:hypothetical protein NDU88_011009 [Pleurodeles waltl]|uniref:Dynein regulatory complex protein 1 C-terminal domain-containing protein n=1 Tax=Pleurodeles waltl TaxID=8319 RepID=A0AAV7S2V0_PLEWA|nr:hypothetical protein NDU88_011009 [Pleurodeles waltl]
MAWAYFCWRDGGGLVIASFSLTFGVADFCGWRYFSGLPSVGQNDRGGLPRPWRCYGGLLSGGKRLLPLRHNLFRLYDLIFHNLSPSEKRSQLNLPQVEARDCSRDAGFWEAMANVIPESRLKEWDALEAAMLKYQ